MPCRASTIAAAFVAGLAATPAVTDEQIDRYRVIAFLESVQLLSLEQGREFCGYFVRTADDRIIATPPRRGRVYECLPQSPFADVEIIASYHTHGRFTEDADSEVPSVDDMLGDREEGVDGYIATPGGRVWFHDLDEGIVELICMRECLTSDPAHDDSFFSPVRSQYTLRQLAERLFDEE